MAENYGNNTLAGNFKSQMKMIGLEMPKPQQESMDDEEMIDTIGDSVSDTTK